MLNRFLAPRASRLALSAAALLVAAFIYSACTDTRSSLPLDYSQALSQTSTTDKERFDPAEFATFLNQKTAQERSPGIQLLPSPVMPQTECGPDGDGGVDCENTITSTIQLVVPASGTSLFPGLAPQGCDLIVEMDVMFCAGTGQNNSVIVMQNLQVLGFNNQGDPDCDAFIQSIYNDIGVGTWVTEVLELFRDDAQLAYQEAFMQIWATNPLNEFKPCDEFPCSMANRPVRVDYYRASCTKICLAYQRECDDELISFLCPVVVPCFEDGCCKRQSTYCKDPDTGNAVVCQGPAFFTISECTTPIDDGIDCILEAVPCRDRPRCNETN